MKSHCIEYRYLNIQKKNLKKKFDKNKNKKFDGERYKSIKLHVMISILAVGATRLLDFDL
jgi:hypothetical protein